jgi:hypothetical protein
MQLEGRWEKTGDMTNSKAVLIHIRGADGRYGGQMGMEGIG